MLSLLALTLLSTTPCPRGALLEGGQHTRLAMKEGPIHLWCRGATVPGGVVLYVHGYEDDVDSAFADHRLAAQFAKSGLEALFIAVAAPSGPGERVAFDDLDALLEVVGLRLGASLRGPVLVVGHSGGHLTIRRWLRSTRVTEIVLLDGFYGDAAPWARWLAKSPGARLCLVGRETWHKAEAWRVALAPRVKEQVKHERANCSHMDIVRKGDWLPRVINEC
ncbi:MAG: hypothetical protein Q8L48_43175 [Archangium sp.]|nr:hypothetical protein [Archangium sp.]